MRNIYPNDNRTSEYLPKSIVIVLPVLETLIHIFYDVVT